MSVNKVILIGNLGKDPEVRYFDKDRAVANITLATSEIHTNKTGAKIKETEWHRVELWDNLAIIADKYLKKGALIYIEGKIRSDSWKDKDGNERSGIKIKANSLNILSSPKNDSGESSNDSGI